jgi:hypothetical protein
MRLPARVVGEEVHDGEVGRSEADREPRGRRGLVVDESTASLEESRVAFKGTSNPTVTIRPPFG